LNFVEKPAEADLGGPKIPIVFAVDSVNFLVWQWILATEFYFYS